MKTEREANEQMARGAETLRIGSNWRNPAPVRLTRTQATIRAVLRATLKGTK